MKTKFENIFYCEYSETYRSYPQNYWLASVENGEVVFNSWDGAIKNFTFKRQVEKLHAKIKETRNIHKRLSKCKNLIPVIVKSNFKGLGVQFWTEWQIKNRVNTNTDKSKAYFVAKL